MENRYPIVALGFIAIVVAFSVLSLKVASMSELQRLAPTADTIAGFSRSRPHLEHLYYVEDQHGKSYIWVGDFRRIAIVPSGPAVYAFDSNGKLLDWGAEAGMGHSIDFHYGRRGSGELVDLRTVMAKLNKSNAED